MSIATQVIALVVALTILDGGRVASLVIFAMLGYWVGALTIAIRRPRVPGRLDTAFLGGGFILIFFPVVLPLAWLVARLGLLR